MMTTRAAAAAILALMTTAAACGGDEGPATGGDADGGAQCTDACTAGERGCDGALLQRCVNGASGCTEWSAVSDCAEDGELCDDSAAPAICAATAGGTCSDGAINQDESDADCGGQRCPGCAVGQMCADRSDCASNNCDTAGGGAGGGGAGGGESAGTCVDAGVATCTDGARNQDESDVDCGGVCARCGNGKTCGAGRDCESGVCDIVDTGRCVDAGAGGVTRNEGFESGDFEALGWALTSTEPAKPHLWQIETEAGACRSGSGCARPHPETPPGRTTDMAISLSVREADEVVFWAKVDTVQDKGWFRFYVDGELKLELTGQHEWAEHRFDVPATGLEGADRELKWEFQRKDAVSENLTDPMVAWVDDIVVPLWNRPPAAPRLVTPVSGTVAADGGVALDWTGFDADGDPMTYQVEIAPDLTFGAALTDAEVDAEGWTVLPALGDGPAFWRVRARDGFDGRWSEWSEPGGFTVDAAAGGDGWGQWGGEQLGLSDGAWLTPAGAGVAVMSSVLFEGDAISDPPGSAVTYTFEGTPPAHPDGAARLDMEMRGGEFFGSDQTSWIEVDEEEVAEFKPSNNTCDDKTLFGWDLGRMPDHAADGEVTARWIPSAGVERTECIEATFRLSYTPAGGTLTSPPITLGALSGGDAWGQVRVDALGPVRIRVLDAADLTPVPETFAPGNAEGVPYAVLHFWDLDVTRYPVIRVQVELEAGSGVRGWTVQSSSGARREWTFDLASNLEGWELPAPPTEEVPPLTPVGDGEATRVDFTPDFPDPYLRYVFPRPIDAAAFSRVEVRLRSSSAELTEPVALAWEDAGGQSAGQITLDADPATFTDLVFDVGSDAGWTGQIGALRIDPVGVFADGMGWIEVDLIAME